MLGLPSVPSDSRGYTSAMSEPQQAGPYELVVVAVSVAALMLVATRVTLPLDPESLVIVDVADFALCGFFFLDYLSNIVRSSRRLRYIMTWGLLDLAASIPAVDALRFGRVARLVRVLRVLRLVKASRVLMAALTHRRRESAVWAGLLIALLVVFTASIAVLELERHAEGNIKTAEDAMWWAVTTVTTVGYGDRYPVTTEGRLVAVGLMVVGVGLFGTLSGAAASWFMQPGKEAEREA